MSITHGVLTLRQQHEKLRLLVSGPGDGAGRLAGVFATKPGDGLAPHEDAARLASRVVTLQGGNAAEQADEIVRALDGQRPTAVHGYFAHRPAAGLPFGTLKRLEIARALAAQPTFLLMDEPASGLTHGEVDELGHTISTIRDQFGLTVLLVEHHMSMVMSISDKVVAMEFGRKIAEGKPEEVRADPEVRRIYLGHH